MDGPVIHYSTSDAVATVVIDRPDRRNAVDHDALAGLRTALASAEADACRAIVLSGAGGHFCAGADLSGVEDTGFVETLRQVLLALHHAAVPTIAAVEGAALGAGTQLAIACDLRVATRDAQFGIPAAKLGLMVDGWTIDRLVRVAGEGPARAMLLAGEVYRGDFAHGIGLVQRLGAPSDAVEWADQIAELAPLTIAGHKLGLNGVGEAGYREAFARAWASADLREGVTAFRDRRPPVFRGR
jgi:enoyl-CoA hydratase